MSEAEHEAVVVTAAGHLVVAFATDEDVVVVVAEELVFALATIELVVITAPFQAVSTALAEDRIGADYRSR